MFPGGSSTCTEDEEPFLLPVVEDGVVVVGMGVSMDRRVAEDAKDTVVIDEEERRFLCLVEVRKFLRLLIDGFIFLTFFVLKSLSEKRSDPG